MNLDSAFMELVQTHERTWGTEQYQGRPTLVQLLGSPIVVMWIGDPTRRVGTMQTTLPDGDALRRYMFSVHQEVDELNEILLGLIVAGKTTPLSNRRLSRIFVKQKPVEIKGVRLLVSEKGSSDRK